MFDGISRGNHQKVIPGFLRCEGNRCLRVFIGGIIPGFLRRDMEFVHPLRNRFRPPRVLHTNLPFARSLGGESFPGRKPSEPRPTSRARPERAVVPRSAVSFGGVFFTVFSRGFPVQLPKKGVPTPQKNGTPNSGGRSEANRAGFTSQLQPSFPEEAHLGKIHPHPHGLPYIPDPWIFVGRKAFSSFFCGT